MGDPIKHPNKRLPVLLTVVIVLFFLCNSSVVFAADSNIGTILSSQEPSDASTPSDTTLPEPDHSPGNGADEPMEITKDSGMEEMPDDTAPPTDIPSSGDDIIYKEASTMEELEFLMWDEDMISEGGYIRVTNSLVIPSDKSYMIWPSMPLVIDLGMHTLYVEGNLSVIGRVKFTGVGGDNGLIRVRTGGSVRIRSVVFEVTDEDGFAIWQEGESNLQYTPAPGSVGKVHFAELPVEEASSFEELMYLLENENMLNTGGTIHVTDDLVIPADGTEYTISPKNSINAPIVVNLGEHTLYVEGSLRIHRNSSLESGIEFTGMGGDTGLIRVRTGGEAGISHAVLTATAQDGYALWQEEGSILQYEPAAAPKGQIHFAEKPVAVPFSYISPMVGLPVAVVHDNQTLEDVLPSTDDVKLYWRGVMDQGTNEEANLIPVEWDLEPYREQLAARQRVLITGSYPEAEAFQIPVCLVVFQNNHPATFLACYGATGYGRPLATVNIELAEPELGCRFEWSQDGKVWKPADCKKIPSADETFRFQVSFPQDNPPVYPYYLSAVVDYPDGSADYSDVIMIEEALTHCDSGGNRGGGTDITTPVQKPDPVSEEPAQPELTPNPEPEESAQPELTPNPEPEEPAQPDTNSVQEELDRPDITPNPMPEASIPGVTQAPVPNPSAGIKKTPEQTMAPNSETSAGQTKLPSKEDLEASVPSQTNNPDADTLQPESKDTEDGLTEQDSQASSNPTKETQAASIVSLKPLNKGNRPPAKTVSIAVGCTATVTLIGAAGIYHSKSLRKRLIDALKKLIRTKK